MNIDNFRGEGGGLGRQSLVRWKAAGGSDTEFARQAMARHDLTKGWRVQEDISGIIARGNQQAAQAAQQQYQMQLQGYQNQLNDWSNRFNNVNQQYQTALAGKTEFEGKFKQASQDYEDAKALAETYKEETVSRQLDAIRRGKTYQGGQTSPHGGIGSGAVSSARRAEDKDSAINIEKKVSAEDSVLARKGPVVETIGRSSASGGGTAGRQALAGGSRHYASRFS